MKIILSPAKKMRVNTDFPKVTGEPVFIDDTKKILAWLREKNREELKEIDRVIDKIEKAYPYPYFVKPSNAGSSKGIFSCVRIWARCWEIWVSSNALR